jgi:hypothetical protein
MLTVKEYETIRRAQYLEPKSIRQIARELGHSRKPVKQAQASGGPGRSTQRQARAGPVLGPYKARIEALLVEAQSHALRNHPRRRLQRE